MLSVPSDDQRIVDSIIEELSLQHGGECAEVAVGGCGIIYVVFPRAAYEIAFGIEGRDPEVVHSFVIGGSR